MKISRHLPLLADRNTSMNIHNAGLIRTTILFASSNKTWLYILNVYHIKIS